MTYRNNKSYIEPSDPYHKSIDNNISNETIIDNWIVNNNGIESLSIERDAKYNTIINITYTNSSEVVHYDGIKNQYIKLDNTSDSRSKNLSNDDANDIKINSLDMTSWNKKGWEITKNAVFIDQSISNNIYSPYVSDLKNQLVKYQWIVDYDTNELITFKLITNSEIIQSVSNTKPEITKSSKLPYSINDFIPTNALNLQDNINNDIQSLKINDITDFSVFMPEYKNVINSSFYMNKNTQKITGSFDIHQASSLGIALETIFIPRIQEEGKAFVIIQGNKNKLIPLIKNVFPDWNQSLSRNITISNTIYPIWLMNGGILNTDPQQTVAIMEIDNTFLYIINQGYSQKEMNEFIASLSITR